MGVGVGVGLGLGLGFGLGVGAHQRGYTPAHSWYIVSTDTDRKYRVSAHQRGYTPAHSWYIVSTDTDRKYRVSAHQRGYTAAQPLQCDLAPLRRTEAGGGVGSDHVERGEQQGTAHLVRVRG